MFVTPLSEKDILSCKTREELFFQQLPGNYIPTNEQAKEIVAEMVRTLDVWTNGIEEQETQYQKLRWEDEEAMRMEELRTAK